MDSGRSDNMEQALQLDQVRQFLHRLSRLGCSLCSTSRMSAILLAEIKCFKIKQHKSTHTRRQAFAVNFLCTVADAVAGVTVSWSALSLGIIKSAEHMTSGPPAWTPARTN